MELLSKNLNQRLKIVIIFSLVILIFASSYLFHLQINRLSDFRRLCQQNFLRYEKILPARGNIVDKNGKLLATNRPKDSIFWQGTGNKQLTPEQEEILNEIISLCFLDPQIKSQVIDAERKCTKICLVEDTNFSILSYLTEKFAFTGNLALDRTFARFYPHKNIASHILGYLGFDKEIQGKTGLEFFCNDELKGTAGEKINTINSKGKNLQSHQTQKGYIGQTVFTTLDLELQKIAEDLFPEDVSGTFILMDPETGALEVLLSRPNFDPNIFLNQISQEEWLQLQIKKCFINRALYDYSPASIFKLVTIAAALDNKLVEESDLFKCNGSTYFFNRFYLCGRKTGHGKLNTSEAIAYSCNIPFYEIAKKIRIDTLADYANRFGLGEKTNILFSEKSGLVPNSAWKLKTKGEKWYKGETLSTVIGQGFLLVTPIQIARMISAIGQGYFVQPRILKEESIIKFPLDISLKIRKFLLKSMKAVATIGSARALNSLSNFKICAKTGTAQTQDREKEIEKKLAPHRWFVSYFKYKNAKPKTLVILFEHGQATRLVIELARKFFIKYANFIDVNFNQATNKLSV